MILTIKFPDNDKPYKFIGSIDSVWNDYYQWTRKWDLEIVKETDDEIYAVANRKS